MKRNHVDRPLNCIYCSNGFDTEQELEHHMGKGDRNKYRCKVKQDMEMVIMAQSGERKFDARSAERGSRPNKILPFIMLYIPN